LTSQPRIMQVTGPNLCISTIYIYKTTMKRTTSIRANKVVAYVFFVLYFISQDTECI